MIRVSCPRCGDLFSVLMQEQNQLCTRCAAKSEKRSGAPGLAQLSDFWPRLQPPADDLDADDE